MTEKSLIDAIPAPPPEEDKVDLRTLIGFALGGFGIAVVLNSQGIFLIFMTDTLGIGAAVGGTLLLVSKVYDMLTDPLMGTISDKTRSPWGRRRPYLLVGGILSAIALGAVFSPPSFDSTAIATVYMGATLILLATGYTIFNVPYLAMPAEMTESYHQRTLVFSWRSGAAAFSTLAVVMQPALVQIFSGGPEGDLRAGYAMMGWVFAAIILIPTVASAFLTSRAKFTQPSRPSQYSLGEQVRLALQNIPFGQLALIKFLQLSSLASITTAIFFFIIRVMEKDFMWISYWGLISSLMIVLCMPIFVKLSRRFGKKNTYILATSFYVLITLTWLFADASEPLWVFLIRAALLGIGSAGVILMGPSLLPDTIEYDYRRTGLRREGIFAGFYTTVEKAAFALGGFLVGLFLQAMGYISAPQGGEPVVQPDSAITAMYIAVGVIPAILSFTSIIVLFFYSLDEERLKATQPVEGAPR